MTETFPPEINGVALTNHRLLRSLSQAGHDVELVRPKPKSATGQERWGAAIEFQVPGMPLPFYPTMQMGHFCRVGLLERWRAAAPDVVHIATEGPLGLAALLAARKLRIPVTSAFHTNFHSYCRDYHLEFLRPLVFRYLRWFHNRCSATFVPTLDLLATLEKTGFQRLVHLGRGVDRKLFHPARRSCELRRQWNADRDTPVVLCVSRVAREKNFPLALEAFRQIRNGWPHLRMVVVGDGPYLATLRRRYPEAHYAGMRYDEDLAAHYASADLFFFCSTTETFGNVVLEAMASGLVVLTYDYAAGRQHIEHFRSGVLVPYDQPVLFKEAAGRLAQHPKDWPGMGKAAREATAQASWEDVSSRFEQVLRTNQRGNSTHD